MLHQFRKEVLDFSRSAEALLAPAALDSELSNDERDMVMMYAKNLLDQYSRHVIRHSTQQMSSST